MTLTVDQFRSDAGGLDATELRVALNEGRVDPVAVVRAFVAEARAGGWIPAAFTEPAAADNAFPGDFEPALVANRVIRGLKNMSGGAVSKSDPDVVALQLQAGLEPTEIRAKHGGVTLQEALDAGDAGFLQSWTREALGGMWPRDATGQRRLFTPEEMLDVARKADFDNLRRDGPLIPNPGITVVGDLAERVPADTVAVYYEGPAGVGWQEGHRPLRRALEGRLGAENVVGLTVDATTETGVRARVRLLAGEAGRAPQALDTAAGTWTQVTPGEQVEEGDADVGCSDCGPQEDRADGNGTPGPDGPGDAGDDAPVAPAPDDSVVTDTAGPAPDETDPADVAPTGVLNRLSLDPRTWPWWAWAAILVAALVWANRKR